MALTLDSDWLREFRRGDVSPVVWIRLEAREITAAISVNSGDATLATATGSLVVGMEITGTGIPAGATIASITDSTHLEMSANATATGAPITVTFKYVFNLLSGKADNITDGQLCIETITPITRALDPYSRELTTDESNVLFFDDGVIRTINATFPLVGKRVIIKVGNNVLGEAEFADYFTGYIQELIPVEGAIEARCVGFQELLNDYEFGGNFVSEHPLVVLKQILLAAGIPADMIDDDSFDPAQSRYDAIEHFTITSISMAKGNGQVIVNSLSGASWVTDAGYETWRGASTSGDGYPGPENFVNARELVNHIVMYLAGILYVRAGQLKFKLFDKTEAVAKHLTVNDYGDFKQLAGQELILNTVHLDISEDNKGRFLTGTDAVSIAEYGAFSVSENPSFLTSKSRLISYGSNNLQNSPFDAAKNSGDAIAESFSLRDAQTSGVTGTQGSGNGGSGAFSFGSGAAAGYVTSSRFGVIEYRGELIKITEIAIDQNSLGFAPIITDDGVQTFELVSGVPYFLTEKVVNKVDVTGGTRGLNSTPIQIADPIWWYRLVMNDSVAHDVTIPYLWATDYVLPRFAHGVSIVEITTALDQWELEVGDLVSIDNDVFLWRNVDGLASTSKLEIVGKEIDPLSDEPKIKFTLAMASPASTPSQTISYTTVDTDVTANGRNTGGLPGGGFISATSGSAIPVGATATRNGATNYDVLIEDGAATVANQAFRWSKGYTLGDVTASKDHYVSLDPTTGMMITDIVATGAAEPQIPHWHPRICKVVSGASNVTAVTDERQIAPITGTMIDRQSLQLDQLVSSPSFDRWNFGSQGAPIGWTASSGTWGTDIRQGTAQYKSGRYSLEFIDSGAAAFVESAEFAVTPGQIYELDCWNHADDNSTAFRHKLYWYTATRASISDSTMINTSADAANTWEQKKGYAVAPATAAFAKVQLSRSTSGPLLFVDQVFVRKAIPTFSAYLSSNQSPTSNDRIDFDTEDHDHGDWFSTGGQKAAAPTAGVYCFNFSLKVEASTDAKVVSVLIRKNASAYNNGTELKTFVLGDINAGSHVMWSYSFEALKLEATDYVSAYITFSSGQPVIGGGAAESSFSGRRIN